MPRVSKSQASANRQAIKQAASRLLRERGIENVSVAEAMAGAGLTHGGFYGHFGSKDDLVAEACAAGFAGSVERWTQRVREAGEPAKARAALVTAYLSKAARNAPGTSCPATSLAIDVARVPPTDAIRTTFAQGMDALVDILAALEPGADTRSQRAAALADFSLLVGSVILARATQGRRLSDELLEAARTRLAC